jgi:hypothetical protein
MTFARRAWARHFMPPGAIRAKPGTAHRHHWRWAVSLFNTATGILDARRGALAWHRQNILVPLPAFTPPPVPLRVAERAPRLPYADFPT